MINAFVEELVRRKLVLIFLLFLVVYSCQTKPLDNCDKFKEGSFKYGGEFEVEGVLHNSDTIYPKLYVTINRHNNEHVEIYKPINKQSTYSVKWLNSCDYVLTLKKTDIGIYSEGDTIYTRIISSNDSSYYYESISKYGRIKGQIIKNK